jgi:hypothetical protein
VTVPNENSVWQAGGCPIENRDAAGGSGNVLVESVNEFAERAGERAQLPAQIRRMVS